MLYLIKQLVLIERINTHTRIAQVRFGNGTRKFVAVGALTQFPH